MRIRSLIAGLAVVLTFVVAGRTQTRSATVLDGVYTPAQAQAGAEQYEAICAACHEGDEPEANAPKGSEFIERWREAPLSFLYNFVRTGMPGDKPGSLSEANYVNLVAYLLEANGYPEGRAELTAAKTPDILLVGPDGPKPLPPNVLVSVVGCLVPTADGFALNAGTSPLRVRVGDETTADELSVSRAAVLGTLSYTLTNAEDFPVSKQKGQKVQAKGVLTKVTSPFRLSVQSLESVGDGCQ